jgi:hypothetical protein
MEDKKIEGIVVEESHEDRVEQAIRGKQTPNLERRIDLAGHVDERQGDYLLTYDEMGYCVKAIRRPE